jgi:hypothetical protein
LEPLTRGRGFSQTVSQTPRDGLNLLALNELYRLPLTETFTSYGGLGVGISVPHAETTATFGGAFDGMPRTFDYRLGGPVVQQPNLYEPVLPLQPGQQQSQGGAGVSYQSSLQSGSVA